MRDSSTGLQWSSSVCIKKHHPRLSRVLKALDHMAPWPSSFYALFLLRFCPPDTWRCLEQKTGSIWRGPVPFLPICFLLFYSGAVFSETFATHYKLSWRSLPTSPDPQSYLGQFLLLFSKINSDINQTRTSFKDAGNPSFYFSVPRAV